MIDIKKYKKLLSGGYKFESPKIKTHIPTPNENDYKNGFIIRYFCQKANDKKSPIFEINFDTYSSIGRNPFYTIGSIRWKISESSNINNQRKSVSESNRLSIRTVEKTIPNLKLYLPNLLQFYK